MRNLRFTIAATIALGLLLPPREGHAFFFMRDTLIEVSPTYAVNSFYHPGGPGSFPLTGFRIQERNGLAGKTVATSFVAIIMAMGQSDKRYTGSTYHYGPGYTYKVDWYQYKSPEEMQAQKEAYNEAVDGTFKNYYQFDLQFFVKSPYSDFEGVLLTLYPWSWSFGSGGRWIFEFGFQGGMIWGTADKGGQPHEYRYSSMGMPFRLIVPIVGQWLLLDNTWSWNWLWMFYGYASEFKSRCAPFTSNLTLSFGERLFLRGGVTLSHFSSDGLGYQAELGFRF